MYGNNWKPVLGYESFYEVSTSGEVRRVGKKDSLKQKVERNGYVRVNLSKNGIAKMELVHRLVAMAFIPNPNGFITVNHIDENKQNNHIENLEWASMSYQNKYGKGAINRNKFKEKPINQFNKNGEFIKRWDSIMEAAKTLRLNPSSIVCVCKKKRRYKSTGGWKFEYAKTL